jgi:hypothetical protein
VAVDGDAEDGPALVAGGDEAEEASPQAVRGVVVGAEGVDRLGGCVDVAGEAAQADPPARERPLFVSSIRHPNPESNTPESKGANIPIAIKESTYVKVRTLEGTNRPVSRERKWSS